ncbi:hypothetical protein KZC51_11600 [Microbacterium sp. SSW1-49]|uniref:Flavodoxin-like domain-containing protein n=1 Tax=Microbacterium croceum TaxID=2851645 RepID=A0ABT0FFD1_9MICO|nr:hypothetical protein [Microbacterium croceum]MCK2036778.1 hypothetical protein [Microbacterium croceum]
MTDSNLAGPAPLTVGPADVSIVFESFFGNTHAVAEAIADGMRENLPIVPAPVRVSDALPSAVCDVLVLGAPTHAHSLSRSSSRREAEAWAKDLGKHLTLERESLGPGIREWLQTDPTPAWGYASFDTRVDMPRIFTGSAAATISRQLRKRGIRELVGPESFLVDKDSHLIPGELERARAWGVALARAVASVLPAVGREPR